MADDKGYIIFVNAKERTVANDVVKYEEVVEIAFPGHPVDPKNDYLVTFEKAASTPHKGTLAAGGKVTVRKHGTEFNVTPTHRS